MIASTSDKLIATREVLRSVLRQLEEMHDRFEGATEWVSTPDEIATDLAPIIDECKAALGESGGQT